MFNITQLSNEHGIGPHDYSEVSGSIIEIDKHTEVTLSL